MSTNITINVSNVQLIQNNKEQQAANRFEFLMENQKRQLEEELLKQGIEEVAEISPDRAVPEFRVIEEPGAQRRESGVGAWLDVNRMRYSSQVPGSSEAIQINVGCGDGTKWATTEIRPNFAKFPESIGSNGSIETIEGVNFRYDAIFPPVEGDINDPPVTVAYYDPPAGAIVTDKNPFEDIEGNQSTNGAVGIWGNEDTYKNWLADTPFYGWDKYSPRNINVKDLKLQVQSRSFPADSDPQVSYLVYPIDNRKAILTTRAFWTYDKQYRFNTEALDQGTFTIQNTGFPEFAAPKVFFEVYWRIPPGGVLVPSNPFEPSTSRQVLLMGSFKVFIWYVLITDIAPEDPNITYEYYFNLPQLYGDFPSLVPPAGQRRHQEYGTVTNAFCISHSNVKEIEVPQKLLDLYDARFPEVPWVQDPDNANSGSYDASLTLPQWTSEYLAGYATWVHAPWSSFMGAGSSRAPLPYDSYGEGPNLGFGDRELQTPLTHLYGSPGIYDYVDSGFKDPDFIVDGFLNGVKYVKNSNYAPSTGTPLFAPDHTVKDSGYSFLTILSDNITNSANGPESVIWLFLKDEQRQASFGLYKERLISGTVDSDVANDIAKAPKNPRFYYSYFKSTPGGVYFGNSVNWLSSNDNDLTLIQTDSFNSLFMKNDKFDAPGRRWEKATEQLSLSPRRKLPPSLGLSDLNRPTHPYLDLYSGAEYAESGGFLQYVLRTSLSIISWTGWGENWRAKLLELGFKGSDFRV